MTLARNNIVQIHIEKQNAGLSDAVYRKLLQEIGGVGSSKDLAPDKVGKLVEAIRKAGKEEREGWSPKQLGTLRRYWRYCGLNETQGNTEVYKVTGLMSCESPGLDQVDYDMAMADLEELLETRINAGMVVCPDGVELDFWRNRNPRNGKANRRELRLIMLLWNELCELIGQDKNNKEYLYGFIAHACRLRTAVPLSELSAVMAHKLTEALKIRVDQEHKKQENAEKVPF